MAWLVIMGVKLTKSSRQSSTLLLDLIFFQIVVETSTVLLRAAVTEHDAKAEHLIKRDSEGVATAQQHSRHFTF